MTLSLSSRFSSQRLPAKGQRIVYVSGPVLKGTVTVLELVPRKSGAYVQILLDAPDGGTGESFKIVKVDSLYEEPRL